MACPAHPIVGGMPIPFAIPECRFERVVEHHRDRLVIPVRLNDVDPRAWLADVLARINDHPSRALAAPLPRAWKARGPAMASSAQVA
ncbi:hypothetical protein M446_4001 [Methylobacterium sp. 4-46]|nr:hypothetical protein M446_4001 [Methylobacterium sp. 4-46]